MDLNGDGKITVDELRQVLHKENLSDEKIKTLIAEVDKDGNGTVDYDEFLALWNPAPSHADLFTQQSQSKLDSKMPEPSEIRTAPPFAPQQKSASKAPTSAPAANAAAAPASTPQSQAGSSNSSCCVVL